MGGGRTAQPTNGDVLSMECGKHSQATPIIICDDVELAGLAAQSPSSPDSVYRTAPVANKPAVIENQKGGNVATGTVVASWNASEDLNVPVPLERADNLFQCTSEIQFLPWQPEQFQYKEVIMPALRSGGQIELYTERATGQDMVVKRVPAARLGLSKRDFQQNNPHDLEDPWTELEIATRLGSASPGPLPGVCRCYGVYRDTNGDALLLSEYLAGGDLFTAAQRSEEPGPEREAAMWPLVKSLLNTVLSLHSFGVAHGDISLENAVLRGGPDSTDVVLIDFAMACTSNLSNISHVRGKPSYQAPEMYTSETYDLRSADLFACGVAAYSLALRGYPWSFTRPGADAAFTYAMKNGIQAFLQKRRVGGNRSKRCSDCLSPRYRRLLELLLHPDPSQRHLALEVFSEDWQPAEPVIKA